MGSGLKVESTQEICQKIGSNTRGATRGEEQNVLTGGLTTSEALAIHGPLGSAGRCVADRLAGDTADAETRERGDGDECHSALV